MPEQPFEVVTLDVQTKPSGIVCVTSKEVPGLYLWGRDSARVFADVSAVIKALYAANRHLEVDVRPCDTQPDDRQARITRYAVYRAGAHPEPGAQPLAM